MSIDSRQYLFPVLPITRQDGILLTTQNRIFGTAFYLGGNIWMTACHVIDNARESGEVGLGIIIDPRRRHLLAFDEVERFPRHDIAIMRTSGGVTGPTPLALSWSIDNFPMAHPVKAGGFPLGFDQEDPDIIMRAFVGHIVSGYSVEGFVEAGSKIYGYELSFQAPKGISGAPLLNNTPERTFEVVGVVLGSRRTETEVAHTQEEIHVEGSTITTHYRTVDTLQLGIAVASVTLKGLKSELLAGITIEEHLANNQLLSR